MPVEAAPVEAVPVEAVPVEAVPEAVVRLTNCFNDTVTGPVGDSSRTPLTNFARLVVENKDFATFVSEENAMKKVIAPRVLYQSFDIAKRRSVGGGVEQIVQYNVYTATADELAELFPSAQYRITRDG